MSQSGGPTNRNPGVREFAQRMRRRTTQFETEPDVEALLVAGESDLDSDLEEDNELGTQRGVLFNAKRASTVVAAGEPDEPQSIALVDAVVRSHDDDPYAAFSALLKQVNDGIKDEVFSEGAVFSKSVFRSHTKNFIHRLDQLIPIAEQFMVHAKNQIGPNEVEGQSDEITAEQNQAQQQNAANFLQIGMMLKGLRALAKNLSQMTNDEVKREVAKIAKSLKASGVDEELIKAIDLQLNLIAGKNTFAKKKRHISSFDSEKSQDLSDFSKRVNIQHREDNGRVEVVANFSYSRHAVLGTSKAKASTQKGAVEDLRKQAKEFVAVAIAAFGRGTSEDNPILIKYNGLQQPELALAILMEYKRIAMESGQTFHAVIDTPERKKVEITPYPELQGIDLSDPNKDDKMSERDYFLKFAVDDTPYIKGRVTGSTIACKECAGQLLLKHEQDMKFDKFDVVRASTNETDLSEQRESHHEKKRDFVADALDSHFGKMSEEIGLKQRQVSPALEKQMKSMISEEPDRSHRMTRS